MFLLETRLSNAKEYQSWSARNIYGYTATFWKSPLLVYIVGSYVMIGWDRILIRLQPHLEHTGEIRALFAFVHVKKRIRRLVFALESNTTPRFY